MQVDVEQPVGRREIASRKSRRSTNGPIVWDDARKCHTVGPTVERSTVTVDDDTMILIDRFSTEAAPNDVYEIKRILIHWKGYGKGESTWEQCSRGTTRSLASKYTTLRSQTHQLEGSVQDWMKAYDTERGGIQKGAEARKSDKAKNEPGAEEKWEEENEIACHGAHGTANASTVKMMLALADPDDGTEDEEWISVGDISTAYLKSYL